MSMKQYLKLCVLSMFILLWFSVVQAYTPGAWDQEIMQKMDQRLEEITDTWGKERLWYVLSILTDRAENIEDQRSLFLLEYLLRRIDTTMQDTFWFPIIWDTLYAWDIDMSWEYTPSIPIPTDNQEDTANEYTNTQEQISPWLSRTLEDFYATYKWQVTSTVGISELCTTYYDKIDAVAKEYDFPTAVIIATWFKEHTCKFSNPSNGRWNFQITSHSYPPGDITWENFENQIINFIYFSKAKWEWYDTFQKYGPEPVKLSYDKIDLTSLRKQAILYNWVVWTLEDNAYANQNFWSPSSGRDGIVAMSIRALWWQLKQDRTWLLYTWKLETTEVEEIAEEIVEEIAEEIVEEIKEEIVEEVVEEVTETSNWCNPELFTENLWPDANHPQVLALQQFLVEQWLYSGTPNGIYDERTTEAVNAFQAFYKSDILEPGGYTSPTGFWYPATRRKANSLACE
jgi:hypothetical protein